MTRKWFIRIVAILLALMMAVSVLYIAVNSIKASAVTQSQIDSLKKQQKEIERKKQEIQSQINSLKYQQSTAMAKKNVLDNQIDLTQQEIANITDQIETYTQLIAAKETEVQQDQQYEDEQFALFKARMRTMEENGTISYIAVVFDASSFADLLARIDFVGDVMHYDQNLYMKLKAAKQATIDAKTALEAAKADQEADKADLQKKQTELTAQLAEAEALVQQLEDNLNQAKELYEQENAEGDKIQADINKKVEELRKQNEQSGNGVVGTGQLTWPTPSCMIVTSPFGMRMHPIYHEMRMHYGIDIGAKYGASIVAADSGTVIISEYSSSYGNYIVISHGNGMTTLYAHMSARLVKAGDKVTKGDTIGKVGSTGASTGAHLHFEVSKNGTRVNPLQYFSGYTKQGW
ncbi:peptidoglycan DD-metalloendopeptidase family protein [Oscillospiraceae bacterium WX1]